MYKNVVYIVLAIILCALQTSFLRIFGVVPNFMLILTVCAAVIHGGIGGGFAGFLCGLLADCTGAGNFGANAFLMMHTGIILGMFCNKHFNAQNIVVVSAVFVTDIIYNVVFYFFAFYIWGKGGMLFSLWRVILPESIYSAVMSLLVLKILFLFRMNAEKKKVQFVKW